MKILEFVEDPMLINDQSLSPAQKMSLKSVYGDPLTSEELAFFKKTSGLSEYPAREWDETTFVLSRRAGKTDKLASNIALYEACIRPHKLSTGETGVVMLVASELKRQARIGYDYCLGKLERSKILNRMILKTTADEITMNNGISIQIYPCNLARVRGMSIVCFIGDEVCFWKTEGRSIDKEVLASVRPGLSFEHSKMIKISSPWMMKGEIYDDVRQYWGKPNSEILVFQGDIYTYRPDYSQKKLEAAKRKDPLAFEQEYLARFRADLSSMYDPATIDGAVNFDRPIELSFRSGFNYMAFADVSGGGGKDSYALAIGHKDGEKIVVDVIRSRAPKFNPEEVTAQYCELLKTYKINQVCGDKFSGDFASNCFAKYGITYNRAEKSKSELYLECEGLLNTGRLQIPNRQSCLSQLKSLVRKARSGGRDSVDTDSGQPEDEANCIAGVSVMLAGFGAGPMPRIWCLWKDASQQDWKDTPREEEEKAARPPEPTKRVEMCISRSGSPDGFRTVHYEAGAVYELPLSLADPWLARGFCTEEIIHKSGG